MTAQLGPVRQIGSVTRDIEASIDFYSRQAGIGPWFVHRRATLECTYLGRPSAPVLTIAFANSGLIQLELIQQEDDTPSIYLEWLARTPAAEVMQHVSMWPTDYSERVEAALAAGFQLELYGDNERGGFCYLRHPGQPDVLIELTELTQERAAVWSAVALAAATWDGTDPVREGSSTRSRVERVNSPSAVPFIASMTLLEGYHESVEVLVSPAFHTGAFEPDSAPLWENTIAIANGDSHAQRRRYVGSLFSKAALASAEENLLTQAIEMRIQGCAPGDDGVTRADVLDLVRLMMVSIAATLVGLDDIDTDERIRALLGYIDKNNAGVGVRWSTIPVEIVIREALEAKARYNVEFFQPSLHRRRELVQRFTDGQLEREQLPDDLITRMLLPEGSHHWDDELRLRETMNFLNAGLKTTAVGVAHAIDDYNRWPGRDPAREDEVEYVRAIANETLRLHPPTPFLVRQASSDVTLSSGRKLVAGEMVAILVGAANRDAEVFGGDADTYRPERRHDLPRLVPHFGLAFGAGPHVCLGKPLVTATGGTPGRDANVQRVLVRILRGLLAAGVVPDRDEAPVNEPRAGDLFRSYPVLLTRMPAATRS